MQTSTLSVVPYWIMLSELVIFVPHSTLKVFPPAVYGPLLQGGPVGEACTVEVVVFVAVTWVVVWAETVVTTVLVVVV